MSAPYTGELRKGTEPGTVVGRIVDAWGWEISLTGTLSPEGGYVLTGVLGSVPEALRVPFVDDAK